MSGIDDAPPFTPLEASLPMNNGRVAQRAWRTHALYRRLKALAVVWTSVGLVRAGLRLSLLSLKWGLLRVTLQSLLLSWFWIPGGLAILALNDRFPWTDDRRARLRALAAHLLACVLFLVVEAYWAQLVFRYAYGLKQSYLSLLLPRSDTTILIYLAHVGVGYAIQAYRQYADRQLETERLVSQLADAQLYILTMQLQPHFLFNTLHLVSELVHENVSAARRTLDNLGSLLRQSFSHATRREVTIGEELAFLESYLDIQRQRFGGRLVTHVQVEDALRSARVPHLLLQPLVENAIRHGIARHAGAGSIVISAARSGDRLTIRVADDGAGLTARSREGIGISNTRLRLRHLHGDDFRFELNAGVERGAEAVVELPFASGASAATLDVLTPSDAFAPEEPAVVHAMTPGVAVGEDDPAQWPHAVAPPADPAATPAFGVPQEMLAVEAENPMGRRFAVSLKWLAIWAITALTWTEIEVLAAQSGARPPHSWIMTLGLNLANVSIWAALTPIVTRLARRFRLGGEQRRHFALHVTFAIAVAVTHMLALHELSRWVGDTTISPLTGSGIIGWGMWDVIAYSTIVAFTHLGDFASWYRERGLESVRLRAEVARTRVQLLRLQLQPKLLLSSLESLSTLAVTDPERCDRMITRLGDLLRAMLARAGDRAVSPDEELEFADALRELQRASLVHVR